MARMSIARAGAAALAGALLLAACSNPVFDAVKRITEAWKGSDPDYWVRSYGGTSYETGGKLVAAADGGYYLVGNTRSFGAGDQDIWVIKFGSDWGIEWQYAYGTSVEEGQDDACLAADGGLVIAAFGNDDVDTYGVVLKLDASGSIVWQKRFSQDVADNDYCRFRRIKGLADGGFLLAGTQTFDDASVDHNDAWMLRLDADGDPAAQVRLDNGASGMDYGFDAIATADGGFALAGQADVAGYVKTWIVKLTSAFALSWQMHYAYGDSGSSSLIRQTEDGGYLLLGSTYSTSRLNDLWILKVDGSGTLAWSRAYGSSLNDTPNYFIPAGAGFLVAGRYQSATDGSGGDALLLSLDEEGSIEWQKLYGGTLRDGIGTILPAEDGFLCSGQTGYVPADPPTTGDAWILNLDGTGGPSYATSSLWVGQAASATSISTTATTTSAATSGVLAATSISPAAISLTRNATAAIVAQLYP